MKTEKVAISREIDLGNYDSGIDEIEIHCDLIITISKDEAGRVEFDPDIIRLYIQNAKKDIEVTDFISKSCPKVYNYFESEAIEELNNG